MARSGIAKGKNKGHITQERELKAKPSTRKGVRQVVVSTVLLMPSVVLISHTTHLSPPLFAFVPCFVMLLNMMLELPLNVFNHL
jgi:hypothetical protein